MYVFLTPDDVWLRTTVYYRTFLSHYRHVAAEYVEQPPLMSPYRCPSLPTLLTDAADRLEEHDGKFLDTMLEQITHLYERFPSMFHMALLPDVVDAFSELLPHVDDVVLLCAGDAGFIHPSMTYHGIDDYVTLAYVDSVTPESIEDVRRNLNIPKDQIIFVGSSPARELNAALTLGLNTARVYYKDFVVYDEIVFEDNVPEFDSFSDFVRAYVETQHGHSTNNR